MNQRFEVTIEHAGLTVGGLGGDLNVSLTSFGLGGAASVGTFCTCVLVGVESLSRGATSACLDAPVPFVSDEETVEGLNLDLGGSSDPANGKTEQRSLPTVVSKPR